MTWERLTIYVDESDRWQGKAVYQAIIEEAQRQGMAGATAVRGIEGFGSRHQGRIATTRIFELASELPIIVTVIDSADKIAQFLPSVQGMVDRGLVIQEPVAVVHRALG